VEEKVTALKSLASTANGWHGVGLTVMYEGCEEQASEARRNETLTDIDKCD